MEEISGGQVGPFEDLEVIRLEAGMSTSRFVKLIDMPERTWRRWQAKARQDRRPKGPWPQPARSAARDLVVGHALAKPVWGHRKIWALTRHDGHKVSQATVLRLLRDEGLLLASQYQKQRRELAADRRAAFAKMPDGPNQVWQLDFLRVRDHHGRHVADRRMPGLVLTSMSIPGMSHPPGTSTTRSPRSSSPWLTTRPCSVTRWPMPARSMRSLVRCCPWSRS